MDNIMRELEKINYGWKDKYNQIHNNVDNSFADNYVLESPEEVINNQVGVCWDQVELERELFLQRKIKFKTYFIVYYDDTCPTHTFLVYEDNDKYYWFEHSWELFKGIHEYDNEFAALIDIKEKFIKYYEFNNNFNPMNLCIYKYEKPNYGISCLEFYKHCEKGESIVL